MESVLISKIFEMMLKNETPTGVIIAGVLIYMLYRIKHLKNDIESIKEDISFIKKTLINGDVSNDNVIKLPNSISTGNKKPNEKGD